MNKPVYFGLSILELNKMLMREFGYNYVKPKYDEKPKLYRQRASLTVSILTVSLYTWNQMIFTKILQKMLKLDLILQIMNWIDHYQNEK